AVVGCGALAGSSAEKAVAESVLATSSRLVHALSQSSSACRSPSRSALWAVAAPSGTWLSVAGQPSLVALDCPVVDSAEPVSDPSAGPVPAPSPPSSPLVPSVGAAPVSVGLVAGSSPPPQAARLSVATRARAVLMVRVRVMVPSPRQCARSRLLSCAVSLCSPPYWSSTRARSTHPRRPSAPEHGELRRRD